MNLKRYSNFLLEKKLYIFQRKFRIDDLFEYGIYSPFQIRKWMSIHKFDHLAHSMFVSLDPITRIPKVFNLRVSSKDIKNKIYFNDDSKDHGGYIIEDSKLIIDHQEIYLYVFEKNSNTSKRARQTHGFAYEGEVKRMNKLKKLAQTGKWDAEGKLDKFYLESKLPSNIQYFNGDSYESLVSIDDQGIEHIRWEIIDNNFKQDTHWNIKCCKLGSSIDMGDFKRISGLSFDGELSMVNDKIDNFMFVIGFHDGDKNVNLEYLILMPIWKWKMYLPDIDNPEIFARIENMYKDLSQFRLKGARTEDGELKWLEYRKEYLDIFDSSEIKIRFKRDTKGQLRIQGAINYRDFVSEILKNNHIRIQYIPESEE